MARRSWLMPPVFAYLDPATGTLIISAIVGAFAAIALVFKNYWYKIKGFFVRDSSPESQVTESQSDEA
jgi:hypothetical protein